MLFFFFFSSSMGFSFVFWILSVLYLGVFFSETPYYVFTLFLHRVWVVA